MPSFARMPSRRARVSSCFSPSTSPTSLHQCAQTPARRQRGGRVLKDRLNDAGALAHAGIAGLHARSQNADLARIETLKTERGTDERGLARTEFTDDAESPVQRNVERHVIDRASWRRTPREPL